MKKVIVIDYVNQGVVIKLIDESDYLILKDKTVDILPCMNAGDSYCG